VRPEESNVFIHLNKSIYQKTAQTLRPTVNSPHVFAPRCRRPLQGLVVFDPKASGQTHFPARIPQVVSLRAYISALVTEIRYLLLLRELLIQIM